MTLSSYSRDYYARVRRHGQEAADESPFESTREEVRMFDDAEEVARIEHRIRTLTDRWDES